MEHKGLGVKEALIKFQPFIEGERSIVSMDHAGLVGARMYENANRRLVVWGTVFRAFPGLDIIHRAGKVHSNVDPLSRLPRIPLHQSPAVDEMKPISDAISEQPIKAWESVIKEPALRATFMATTWGDVLEASPEDLLAWAITRRQARESGSERKEAEKELAEWKEGQKEERRAGQKRSEKGRSDQSKAEAKPGQLGVSIARATVLRYVKGYLQDPTFEEHWRASISTADKLLATHQYYKDEDGLLFFTDTDC